MKILNNDMYILLIDEEAEIKEGWAINPDGNLDYFGFDWRAMWTREQILDCKNVIAYCPLTKEAKELELPLLPNPFEVDFSIPILQKELNKRAKESNTCDLNEFGNGLIRGFKAAQSKQFSLEDIKKAIEMSREYEFIKFGNGDTEHKYSEEEIIQSISTQQFPKQLTLEDMIAFGKKCFYKGFDKSENDDSNCYTAWREENSSLVQSLSTQQLPKEFVISDKFSTFEENLKDGEYKW